MTLALVIKNKCENDSSITYNSKAMDNVKIFAEKQMDRPKTIHLRSIDLGA